MNRKERTELAKWVAVEAGKNGAGQSSVSISKRRRIEIEFRDGQIETLKESTQNSLALDLYVEGKYSSHSTNNMEKENLKKFISETASMTRYLSRDEFRKLPDPSLYEGRKDIDLQINDSRYPEIETAERVEMVKEIESAAKKRSDQLISATAGYSDTFSESVMVNSNGFTGEKVSTSYSCGAEATVKDGEKGRPEDYHYVTTRFFDELPPPSEIGQKAVDYAVRKIGQEKIGSGIFDMIIENRAVGRILYALFAPMSAGSIQQKRSFLEGKLGERIASEKLTLIDDPFIPGGLGSRTFDNEGISSRKRPIIEKGILRDYFIDNYYGRKLGLTPNSGSASNLVFEYGSRSHEEMIRGIEKGIFVTNFIGGNSNPTTGDFSHGIMGLLIEKGKIIKPVNEMNITGSIAELWGKLEEVGNDPYTFSSWRTPSVRFSDIHFSGI